MVAGGSRIEWQQGQDALRDEVARVTTLLRSIHDPGSHAVGQWNLAEVAMHLSQAWVAVPGLARRDLSGVYEVVPDLAGVAGDSLIRDMWDLGDTTALAVRSDPERDPAVLADRIETRAQEYFTACVGAEPDAPRPWLVQGVTVGQSTLTYHLLNETVMHGYDIAQAAGRPWRIEPAHAAMVLGRFIVPVLQVLDSRAMVNGATAAGLRATYDIRIGAGIASISSSTTGN
ncbi:MAG: maleylpyruvate isomerase N-terminal domain-containing protein [Pseudonocardiaceae bacterium]